MFSLPLAAASETVCFFPGPILCNNTRHHSLLVTSAPTISIHVLPPKKKTEQNFGEGTVFNISQLSHISVGVAFGPPTGPTGAPGARESHRRWALGLDHRTNPAGFRGGWSLCVSSFTMAYGCLWYLIMIELVGNYRVTIVTL